MRAEVKLTTRSSKVPIQGWLGLGALSLAAPISLSFALWGRPDLRLLNVAIAIIGVTGVIVLWLRVWQFLQTGEAASEPLPKRGLYPSWKQVILIGVFTVLIDIVAVLTNHLRAGIYMTVLLGILVALRALAGWRQRPL